jgi:hypothetical protein
LHLVWRLCSNASMNRREFVRTSMVLSGAAVLGAPTFAQGQEEAVAVSLRLDPKQLGHRIPADFTGLSYEKAQMSDPAYFSGANTALAGMMRRLGPKGVLRIGGNTSEYCFWTPEMPAAEVAAAMNQGAMGPDPGHKPAVDRKISSLAVRNLRDFVDATGWTLIYGLNMGKGTAADAADEAAYVMKTIGKDKLVAFQLCNEPDLFYRNGIRTQDYNAAQFNDEWKTFYDAIRARVPDAPFAGPDTAYGLEWMVPFADRFKDDVKFLSSHYYAEGPPTDPSMTIDRLLRNPTLQKQFGGMQQVLEQTKLPFRLAETNSCYAAGRQGVSDTFASALWGADLMYQLAQAGGIGINFHGGGYGWYTPIAGTTRNGFVARPIFYGMLLFAQAGPGTLIDTKILGGVDAAAGSDAAPMQSAYGLVSDAGKVKLVVFNRDARAVRLSIDPGSRMERATALRLSAPRIEDTTDTTLGSAPVGASGEWAPLREEKLSISSGQVMLDLPAASAALVSFS